MEEIPKRNKRQISIDSKPRVQLGTGGFGSVFKGKYKGRPVAVKRVLVQNCNRNEEEAMKQLNHPNIVKLFHCESDKDFGYYALELCVASLDKLFLESDDPKKYNGPMPRQIDSFLQLASGNKIVVTLKWADFGLSKSVNERGTCSMSALKGTRNWIAPELLRPTLDGRECRGDIKSDVFAQGLVFGCIFLDGEHLYGSKQNKEEILKNIKEGNPVNMQKINIFLRNLYENDLLQKMLENEPITRITSTEVVKQLQSIKEKLTGKQEKLRQLCSGNSQFDLTGNIEELIQFQIDVNAKNVNGRNALHLLCRDNSSKNLTTAIQILIQSGIDVNAINGGKKYIRWINGFVV
ncbi:serine/threonine-protein kinase/endoribonuclease ire-1 [Daphnia magna]|uniref:serine/threonine-protein kinase/endoribonuclease ire-1 n=1 Tax=Daphnia magna TaxID=35525 RepID=UPI001E1BBF67|nr:serine/threonine-protein kinase/endoribonuclease ire-1 [Daphnia magna]